MAAKDAAGGTTIIKRIKKGGHAAHGGAWKVAYADFVTAMMAFFLLLWLLNSVTQEQLEGISSYFAPVSASVTTSGSGEILGGKTIAVDGAMPDESSRPSVTLDLPPPKAGSGPTDQEDRPQIDQITDRAAEELLRRKEEDQFKEAEAALRQAIESVPSLKNLADNLLIDNTPEGLRIQIIDQEGTAMFPRGSAELYLHTKKVLELVAKVILTMPQKISISGHTDATRFVTDSGYGNWELSADRANSVRRYLTHLKVPEERVNRVVGKAETEPLLPDNPTHASNRRLSIILLRRSSEELQKAARQEPESLPGLGAARARVAGEEPPPEPAPEPALPPSITIPLQPSVPATTPPPAPTRVPAPVTAPVTAQEPPAPPMAVPPTPAPPPPPASGGNGPRQIIIPLGRPAPQ